MFFFWSSVAKTSFARRKSFGYPGCEVEKCIFSRPYGWNRDKKLRCKGKRVHRPGFHHQTTQVLVQCLRPLGHRSGALENRCSFCVSVYNSNTKRYSSNSMRCCCCAIKVKYCSRIRSCTMQRPEEHLLDVLSEELESACQAAERQALADVNPNSVPQPAVVAPDASQVSCADRQPATYDGPCRQRCWLCCT